MNLFDRIYKMHELLKYARYPISRLKLQEELACSRATINRILYNMKLYFQAPIEFDRNKGGYLYSRSENRTFELPGLWFNASEIRALLTVQHLLAEIQPGLLAPRLAPFRERIDKILKLKHAGCSQVARRVRLLGAACRHPDPEKFQAAAGALLQRKRLAITYHSRSRDKTTRRVISPQRLVHYRDNWYLDAWDHGKRTLRSFAVERIKTTRPVDQSAKEIPDRILDEQFAAAYGIFAGKPKNTAVLRFTAERSRWVAEEVWHPSQKGRYEDGRYVLEVPYSDSRELVMDILKHGPEVEVLEPEELRKEVIRLLKQALKVAMGSEQK